MSELTDRDRAMLGFEDRYPQHSAAKDELIRSAFAMPAARYYQLLNQLVGRQEAVAAYPSTVSRYMRNRDARFARRASRVVTARRAI